MQKNISKIAKKINFFAIFCVFIKIINNYLKNLYFQAKKYKFDFFVYFYIYFISQKFNFKNVFIFLLIKNGFLLFINFYILLFNYLFYFFIYLISTYYFQIFFD